MDRLNKEKQSVAASLFAPQVFFWDVSLSGIRGDFRFSLCCRWSSTRLLQPQLAAHAVVILVLVRSGHLRFVVVFFFSAGQNVVTCAALCSFFDAEDFLITKP